MIWLANLLAGLIILPIALVFLKGRGTSLIAGYNTMSEEQRAKFDGVKLAKFMGKELLVGAAVLLAGAALMALDIAPFGVFVASWSVFLVVIMAGMIYVNLSKSFRKKA